MGMTPPIRNMLTSFLNVLKSGMPFGVHGGNCCLRERSDPTIGRPHGQRKPRRRGDAYGTVDHGEKPASERENVHRDSAAGAATAAAAGLRPKLCDDMQQPPVKRGMSSIVFATANITSTDPRQSTAKRSVRLNCGSPGGQNAFAHGVKWKHPPHARH